MKLRQRAGRFTRRGLSALPRRVASDGRDPQPLEAPCGRISASGGLTGATSPPTFRSATRTPPVTASLVSRARLFATGSMLSDTLRPAGAHTGAHELRFSEFAGRTPQRIRSRNRFGGLLRRGFESHPSATTRGKGSGPETQVHGWTVIWIADGEVTRRQIFLDRDQAREAAGLRE
jgi:hypothetical protein